MRSLANRLFAKHLSLQHYATAHAAGLTLRVARFDVAASPRQGRNPFACFERLHVTKALVMMLGAPWRVLAPLGIDS